MTNEQLEALAHETRRRIIDSNWTNIQDTILEALQRVARAPKTEDEAVLWHQSGVNAKGEPFIQLIRNDRVVAQMSPSEARDHARAITEAAEASEQDAFMLEFLGTDFGLSAAASILVKFRRWREVRGKRGPGSDPKEFVLNASET